LVVENITKAIEANFSIELHNWSSTCGKSVPCHITLVEENITKAVEANLSNELHNLVLYLQ
jgi:hypothetical protein